MVIKVINPIASESESVDQRLSDPIQFATSDPTAWPPIAITTTDSAALTSIPQPSDDFQELQTPGVIRRLLNTNVQAVIAPGVSEPEINKVGDPVIIRRDPGEQTASLQSSTIIGAPTLDDRSVVITAIPASNESFQETVANPTGAPVFRMDAYTDYNPELRAFCHVSDVSLLARLDFNRNSFVTTAMTADAFAFETHNTEMQSGNLRRSALLTEEYCARSEKLQRLESSRAVDRNCAIAELRAANTFDWIIEGKGHGGIIAALTALREDPGAKIAIIGEEANFWTKMGFSIAVVGNIHGFLEELGGAVGKDLLENETVKDHLKKHNGQMCGAFLGRWIEENLKEFMDSGRITVLNGRASTPPQVEEGGTQRVVFEVNSGCDSKQLILFTSHPSAVISPMGLGKAIDMPFTDRISGALIPGRSVKDELNGFPIAYDNGSYQLDLAERVRRETVIRLTGSNHPNAEREHVMQAMIMNDIEMARREDRTKVTYLLSGNGDGSFSVLEGILEGLGRDVRRNLQNELGREPFRPEFVEKFVEALGPIEIVWAGKDTLQDGWRASQNIRRYALIAEYIEILTQEGKLHKVDEYVSSLVYDRNSPGTAFQVTTSPERGNDAPPGTLHEYPVTRVFNSIGNQGAGPLLRSVFSADNPGSEIPSGPDLIRNVDLKPIYDGNDPVCDVTGIAVLNKNGENLEILSGTSMYALSLAMLNAYKGFTPPEDSDFFLHKETNLAFFQGIVESMNDKMLHLQSLQMGRVMLDFNPDAEVLSPLHKRDDFRNPAGVYYGGILTDSLMTTLVRERRNWVEGRQSKTSHPSNTSAT